jgi:alpha-1,3-rhamnosyl/mannosyltransferase
MRLLFDGRCVQDGFPGIGRYAYRLIEAMVRLPGAPEISVLVPDRPNTRFPWDALEVCRISTDTNLFSPINQLRLGRQLRRGRYDLCHFPYILHPLGSQCPRVVTVHDLIPVWFPDELASKWRRWTYCAALRVSMAGASALLTPTRYVAEEIRRRFGYKGPVGITPHGVDPLFIPHKAPGPILAEYGLDPGYLLTVSSHRPHKNLIFLLEVYREVAKVLSQPVPLVIVGSEGTSTPRIERAVAEWGMERTVRFLKWVPENHLPAIYSGAYLFLFPSLMEGFGFPPLEARACGCPALVSDIPPMRETAGPGSILLAPSDHSAWVSAIVDLFQDTEKRQAMATSATEAALTFNWTRTASLTLEVYRKVIR